LLNGKFDKEPAMPAKKLDRRTQLLIDIAEQAYHKRAWHGTNLRGSLRGLKVEEALWRPGPDRHNIWEIALHTAYWKYAVWRKLAKAEANTFPRKGSNFPELPEPTNEKSWKQDMALLGRTHLAFIEAISNLPASQLSKNPPKMKYSWERYIYGVASHDLYHAGQIQLLKRLYRTR